MRSVMSQPIGAYGELSTALNAKNYDPTNGTVSGGDVYQIWPVATPQK